MAAEEGPCLTALRVGATTYTDDFGGDARWPVFSPAAATQTGILSMLSDPLMIDEDDILGAPNLYSSKPEAFNDDSVTTASRPRSLSRRTAQSRCLAPLNASTRTANCSRSPKKSSTPATLSFPSPLKAADLRR